MSLVRSTTSGSLTVQSRMPVAGWVLLYTGHR